uniref:TAR DNA-binding protein 43 n=1 Tax=Cacopsylla melanoneura TaxID=428564 RepID=A0A8D8QG74_9HEMI
MAQYIFITNNLEEDAMEVPSEDDGTILLSTLQAQYPAAIGLKYKVESRYRAVKLADGRLYAPLDGWQDRVYFCTFDAKSGAGLGSVASQSKRAYPDNSGGSVSNTDLVVLGIPWNFSDNELKDYFEQFGPMEYAHVKIDKNTGRSKGFGFIRFTSHENALKVMLKKHKIGNRICDVRIPESTKMGAEEPVSSKVFVGSLTPNLTEADLREFFEQHGTVTEVLIPKPFREFAFVTFDSDAVAKSLVGQHMNVKDTNIVVMEATPKKKNDTTNMNWNNQNSYDRRNERSRSPNRGHYGGGGGNGYFDNRQQQQQQGGYNNKRRRNDYDDWHQGNGGVNNATMSQADVLQAAVSKAVSEVLSVQKGMDPWSRH